MVTPLPTMLPLLLPALVSLAAAQRDLYSAKPWIPANVSPGVAEFLQPGPPSRPPGPPPGSPYDLGAAASGAVPVRVATPSSVHTQLTPPRPRRPPPGPGRPRLPRKDIARSDNLAVDPSSNEIPGAGQGEGQEVSTLVNFGDWAAQWDELEEAWWAPLLLVVSLTTLSL